MIPAFLAASGRGDNGCAGAPTFNGTPTLSDNLDTCFPGGGWDLDVDFAITGTQGTFEYEVWTKEWEGGDSEPGSYSFQKRITGAAGTHEIESDAQFGSDGAGSAETRRRKAILYVVPGTSANGAGPFCSTSSETTQLNRAGNLCTI